jgi:hypothetical protein
MNSKQELMMCRKEIENDHLYKEVMERIEDEWNTEKLVNPRKHILIGKHEYIDGFKHEQANQENSGEDYRIEFDNIKQLMLYQKWCYLSVNTNFGTCENNISLFDMRNLKNQVIYWIMNDFQGFEEDWEEEEEEEEEQE